MSLPAFQPAAATGGKALWYLTRASGVVALVLLTVSVVMGIVAAVGWATERWPRFLSQRVHRNVSLFCVGFVALHVATTVTDGYVPIGLASAFLPFLTPYRPIWIGLGALGLDLLLVVMVTSALRHRIGYSSWRFIHWLAYLCWPIAVLHSLGSGSDSSLPVILAIDALSAAAVLAGVGCRLATGRTFPAGRRVAAAVGTVLALMGLAVFAAVGPLRPHWSLRAGTSKALLAQLARKYAPPASDGAVTTAPGGGVTRVPAVPFRYGLNGTETTVPDGQGQVRATFTLQLQDPTSTPLDVVLNGTAARGGGLTMSSGTVTFGGFPGTVTRLHGNSMKASVAAPGLQPLTLSITVDGRSSTVSGSVTGADALAGG